VIKGSCVAASFLFRTRALALDLCHVQSSDWVCLVDPDSSLPEFVLEDPQRFVPRHTYTFTEIKVVFESVVPECFECICIEVVAESEIPHELVGPGFPEYTFHKVSERLRFAHELLLVLFEFSYAGLDESSSSSTFLFRDVVDGVCEWGCKFRVEFS